MTPPSEPARRYLDRFSRAERAVHWITATLMIVCIVTAAILYNGSLSIQVGHRHVVELIHVYAGFALPVPMLFGLVSAAYRADLAGSTGSVRPTGDGCGPGPGATDRSASASSTPARS